MHRQKLDTFENEHFAVYFFSLDSSLVLENGRNYYGEVDIEMNPDGFGTETYPSGKILYVGHFKKGQKEGLGTFYYESGLVGYRGQFKNNFMDGQGLLFYQDSGTLLFNGTLKKSNFVKGDFFFENSSLSESI